MTTTDLCENLDYLMKIHGHMTVSELSRHTKLPQPTLHHLLSGSTKRPRRQTLQVIANFFAVNVSELLGQAPLPSVLPSAIKDNLNVHPVPILSWEQLAKWPNALSPKQKVKDVLIVRNVGPKAFAVIMPDQSMAPLFPQGTQLIFDPDQTIKDRDCIMVYIGAQAKVFFKRLILDGKKHFLKSESPELVDNALYCLQPDHDKIIARLIECRLLM